MRDATTARAQRVRLFLRLVHAGWNLPAIRAERADLWPPGPAGDRKWTRDRRDALALKADDAECWRRTAERRDRLVEWLEAHPGATTAEVARAIGCSQKMTDYELRLIGAEPRIHVSKQQCRSRWATWRLPESANLIAALRTLLDAARGTR